MAQLQLFIAPPYDDWKVLHGYGFDPDHSEKHMHHHLALTTTTDAPVLAAASGRLSVIPPMRPARTGLDPVTVPAADAPLPADVTLFLHLSPAVIAHPGLSARLMQAEWSLLQNKLLAFRYGGLDPTSLEQSLGDLLDDVTIGKAVTRSQAVRMLVQGDIAIRIPAGRPIGTGAAWSPGVRRVDFAAITQRGAHDPVQTYDWLRELVAGGQQAVDAFLAAFPKRWPVLTFSTGALFVNATASLLYSSSVLEEGRAMYGLTPAQWRVVGDNQKALWRQRLLQRFGKAPSGDTTPRFEFDDSDWQNVFQLEAVTEFMLNFNDPWRPASAGLVPGENVPRAPKLANGEPDPQYEIVDLLPPAGVAATITTVDDASQTCVVHLDDPIGLQRVRVMRDTLSLANSAPNIPRLWLILSVDLNAHTVTIAGIPKLSVSPSHWEILLRPSLVLIDSFGPRHQGTNAVKVAASTVELQNIGPLERINPGFATVYLPSDSARESRTYRIVTADTETRRLELDGDPQLEDNVSAWQIPGGLSGQLPRMTYSLLGGATGYDHYDGVMFVVASQGIVTQVRWTSYTSRTNLPADQEASSVRGNKRYDYRSFRSGDSAFRNYCFRVIDPNASYDGVREARWYFDIPVRPDIVIPPAQPVSGGGGKAHIRLHLGNTNSSGSNSEGCLVSPNYYTLRDTLVRLHQYEQFELSGSADSEIEKLFNKTHQQSMSLHAATGANGLPAYAWDEKLIGTLYLVRPDELPLG